MSISVFIKMTKIKAQTGQKFQSYRIKYIIYIALNGTNESRNLLLNIAIDSEFLIATSNWNQSLNADGKKEFL